MNHKEKTHYKYSSGDVLLWLLFFGLVFSAGMMFRIYWGFEVTTLILLSALLSNRFWEFSVKFLNQ